ncbi:Ser/Thr protein phosphatase, putative [Trichomonas vaginalis G3]|uniref:Ser/Thr protein phosphatase, putative n=1 Tax=Trichomonas vaginalis (strain ATCC PRA-98 / G3) TaxID=412133 RepID=A2G7J3_TRIV3|nr:Ser/Thr protein phosphatase, putative [Trichomonas vaginalis G3]|eukprot:XP_001299798.1 Ser/Thr protein phosphatase [Trichomonas vaginalis G3]
MGEDVSEVDEQSPKSNLLKWIFIAVAVVVVIVIIVTVTVVLVLKKKRNEKYPGFLYLNDIHIDLSYNPKSNKDWCHSQTNNLLESWEFGQYNCDPPPKLYDSLVESLKTNVPSVDFILLGGDLPSHDLGGNYTFLKEHFRLITDPLEKLYPNKKIFITLGNNDFQENYGSFKTDLKDFENAHEVFGKWMNEEQSKTFKKGGYYYEDMPELKLRLLLLNTVMYTNTKSRVFNESLKDPYDQFAWIRQTYKEGVDKGYKVGVALHVPPGIVYYKGIPGFPSMYLEEFGKVFEECDFSFTISGHSHIDTLNPLYKANVEEDNIQYSLSAVSVSPSHYNNPGYRYFEIKDGVLQDYTQFYADIMMNPDSPKWEVEYKFRDAYKVKDLSKKSLNDATRYIRSKGSVIWSYRGYIYSQAEKYNPFFYCALRALTKEDVFKCSLDLNVNLSSIMPYSNRGD